MIRQNVIENKTDMRFVRALIRCGRNKIAGKGLIWHTAMICVKTNPVSRVERLKPIHHTRQISRAKTIIDVDHADVGRATIEHAQQRGEAMETRAITHARRYGDHGHTHHASHHAGERSFHFHGLMQMLLFLFAWCYNRSIKIRSTFSGNAGRARFGTEPSCHRQGWIGQKGQRNFEAEEFGRAGAH